MVSIGIPTFNQPEYLRQAVQSVLNQTFQEFEIIIVDDCSTDDTPEVVRQFIDPRIRYHRTHVNLRPPRSWNECVRLARGKYFSLLPHDDLYAPAFLAQMVATLENTPSVGFAQCAHVVVNDRLDAIENRYLAHEAFVSRGEGALVALTRQHLMNPASILFRRRSIIAHGPWDVHYWDDEVLILRIAFHDGFAYLPTILASVRIHSGNLSAVLVKEEFDLVLNVINQQTAIFSGVLPMTQGLMELRSMWNRQLSYSCVFHAVKDMSAGRWRIGKINLERSINLYPCVLIDPRLYFLALKKIVSKYFVIKRRQLR